MNEEALQYSYELFTKDGYNGSLDDYKSLINSNEEALDYSYSLFSKDGYNGDKAAFSSLIGVGSGKPAESQISTSVMGDEPDLKKKDQAQPVTQPNLQGVPSTPSFEISSMEAAPAASESPTQTGGSDSTSVPTQSEPIDVSQFSIEQSLDPVAYSAGVESEKLELPTEEQEKEAKEKKEKEAKYLALGKEEGKFISSLTGSEDAVRPEQIPLLEEKIESDFKPDYEEVALNYLDLTTTSQGDEIRDRRENDPDFYKPSMSGKLPVAELKMQGMGIVSDIRKEEYSKASKEFKEVAQDELNGINDKLKEHQKFIVDGKYTGGQEAFEQYQNLQRRAQEIVNSREVQNLLKAEKNLQSVLDDFKSDKDIFVSEVVAFETKKLKEKQDNVYKEGTWVGNFGRSVRDITTKSVGNLAKSLASIPKMAYPNDKYDVTDKIKDFTYDVFDEYDRQRPVPTKLEREFWEKYAEVDGNRVVLKDGSPTGKVYGPDGWELSEKASSDILSEYEKNKPKYKEKNGLNIGAGVYSSSQSTADMLVTLMPIAGQTGKLTRMLGAGEKASSIAGVTTGVMVQTMNGFYDEAKELGASDSEALAFATIYSASIAAIASLNPMEAKIIQQSLKDKSSKAVQIFIKSIKGGSTRKEAIWKGVQTVLKESGKEGLEEITEIPVQQSLDVAWEKAGGIAHTTDGDVQDYVNTFALASFSSLPFSFTQIEGRNKIRQESIYAAIQDIESVEKMMKENKKKMGFTDEFVTESVEQLRLLKKQTKPYFENENLGENEKIAVTALLREKNSLLQDKKDLDSVASKVIDEKISEIDDALSTLLDKKSDSPLYMIEGEVVSKEELEAKLEEEEFSNGVKQGRYNITVENDEKTARKVVSKIEGVEESDTESDQKESKQKGRLTKFSTPQNGIVGEVTYEDGTKKELTQEEYDALEKQEGLFDVETGTQPVAETVPTEAVAEEAAPVVKETEKSLEEGKVEITDVKSGTHTSTKPIKIFKGIGGKKDLNGIRINAHKGAEGFFTAVDKNLAEDYARGEGISETVLPVGTTFEVVEIDGTGMTPGQYRDAEVKAINESKADVVKLITVDGKIKAGTKKQEQYVIKNEKLIEDAIQEQAAGKVPVQPEAKPGEKMEEGKPKAEPEVTAEKGKEEVSEEEVKKVADSTGTKPKNIRDLYNINRDMFGQDRVKSLASAIVMDRAIAVMAKRAGISKAEMYSRLQFKKAENVPNGVKFQIDAWHGSPYEFAKFELSKIGTGEGAQAFGWGLYFTDLEGIARDYAENLSDRVRKGKGILLPRPMYRGKEINDIINNTITPTQNEFDAIIKNEKKRVRNEIDKTNDFDYELEMEDYLSSLDKVKSVDDFRKFLYKVSLHKGKTPDQYTFLEWDKGVDRKLINLIKSKLTDEQYKEGFFDTVKALGISQERYIKDGETLYNALTIALGSDKAASLFLLENGIDGIKYPAESISRGATSDTARGFNYVVFDENAVSIEEVIKFQKDANKARGAAMVNMDGTAVIYAMTDPNVSTPLHEIAHVFEHYLTDAERKAIMKFAGTKEWGIETSEKFSRGFEKYLADGIAPTEELQKIFDKFKQWMLDIYNGITGSEIDIKLNDEMRGIYDAMLGKEEVLSEEDAKSEEKVKEFAEKQMSDEKNQEEADKEIESKSEEELKEDVPDVLESISESEREKLDREAKFKGKSTVDYVIDYLKGKLKNIRQSIKNILDKIKSNYRKAIIGTSIIVGIATMGTGVELAKPKVKDVFKEAIEFVSPIVKEASKSNILSFAESNKEIFSSINETVQESGLSESIKGHFANVASQSGAVKAVKQEVSLTKQEAPKETDVVDNKLLDSQTFNENIDDSREPTTGITQVRYREQYPASRGSEFVLIGSNQERKGKDIEGVERISHFMLDGNFVTGADYTSKKSKAEGKEEYFKSGDVYRYVGNRGNHKTGIEIDGYVPYILKRSGDRAIVTYKRYSEISKSKDVNEVLKDKNILTPLRQFKFGEIDWDRKPIDKEVDEGGDRVYKSAVELLLKDGVPNPYREGRLKGDGSGKPLNPRGTYIFYTPASGESAYGRYNGGSFVFIFDYNGETFVRDFAGSITDVKAEGRDIAKKYGISENDITIGFHDAGSVSTKPKATNGKIVDKTVKKVNSKGIVTSGLGKPTENKIPRDKPTDGETPISLMALPLLFGGARRKRKPISDPDVDDVVTSWMEDVQKVYDSQSTKDKQEALNQAAVNLYMSGKLQKMTPDQVQEILDAISKESKNVGKKWSVSTIYELEGLSVREQFKQGFEEYIAALKEKEYKKREKAIAKAQEKIEKAKEAASKLKGKMKSDREARAIFKKVAGDIMKGKGINSLSRGKISQLLTKSRDVNAGNLNTKLSEVFDVLEKQLKENQLKKAKEYTKKFENNIKKGKFGTLTMAAKQLLNITPLDIPKELLSRHNELMYNLSKSSPTAKDLQDLAQFISDFKNEIDKRIVDVMHFADVYNEFKQTGESDFAKFLENQGYTEAQIDFYKENKEAISTTYKSIYEPKSKDTATVQEKIQEIAEKLLEAKKKFRELKKTGLTKIDVAKIFDGAPERAIEIAEFFNQLTEDDIEFLSLSEANKLEVIYENLQLGLVTNQMKKMMYRIKGEKMLDDLQKENPVAKRKLIPGTSIKSVMSNAKLVSKVTPLDDSSSIKGIRDVIKKMEGTVLDYVDDYLKGFKGKPLYNALTRVINPIVNTNTKTSKLYDDVHTLFENMKGSPLYNTTLMSLYFRAREYENNPETRNKNKNPLEYIEATLESPKVNDNKKAVLRGMKGEFFRNGEPDLKAIEAEIKKRGGFELVELMDSKLAEQQANIQFSAEVDGAKTFEFVSGYAPRGVVGSSQSLTEFFESTVNGANLPSLKTNSTEDRTSTVNALTFDAVDDFLRTYSKNELVNNVAPAIAEVRALISAAKRSGNDSARKYAEILEHLLKEYIKNTLAREHKQRGFLGSTWNKMVNKLKTGTLAGVRKMFVESIIQGGKVLIDSEARDAFFEHRKNNEFDNKSVLDALGSKHSQRTGILSSEMAKEVSYLANRVKSGEATTKEEILYKILKSPLIKPIKKLDDAFKVINTALIKIPDKVGTAQVVIGGAALKFKELTGTELDREKLLNDPYYRAKYKEELKKAVAYGDKLGTRIGGPGSLEQKSINDLKGEGINSPLNRYVRGFSTNENMQIISAIATLMPSTTKGLRRERGSEFKDKKAAASGLVSSIFGLTAYKTMNLAISTAIIHAIQMAFGDDDDEFFENWDWNEYAGAIFADTIWTALAGRLGVVETIIGQSAIIFAMNQMAEDENEEVDSEVRKFIDSMFYSAIDNPNITAKTAVGGFGAEGKILYSLINIATDFSDDLELDSNNPYVRNNMYTLLNSIVNVPASQDVGQVGRKLWFDGYANRLMNESFGRGDTDSRINSIPEREILKLHEKTRDKKLIPSIIETTERTVKGRVFEVSDFKLRKLQKIKGDIIKDRVKELVRTNLYRVSSDEEKAKLIKETYKGWDKDLSIKKHGYKDLNHFYVKNSFLKRGRAKGEK